jgi:hypothetical protein
MAWSAVATTKELNMFRGRYVTEEGSTNGINKLELLEGFPGR